MLSCPVKFFIRPHVVTYSESRFLCVWTQSSNLFTCTSVKLTRSLHLLPCFDHTHHSGFGGLAALNKSLAVSMHVDSFIVHYTNYYLFSLCEQGPCGHRMVLCLFTGSLVTNLRVLFCLYTNLLLSISHDTLVTHQDF